MQCNRTSSASRPPSFAPAHVSVEGYSRWPGVERSLFNHTERLPFRTPHRTGCNVAHHRRPPRLTCTEEHLSTLTLPPKERARREPACLGQTTLRTRERDGAPAKDGNKTEQYCLLAGTTSNSTDGAVRMDHMAYMFMHCTNPNYPGRCCHHQADEMRGFNANCVDRIGLLVVLIDSWPWRCHRYLRYVPT